MTFHIVKVFNYVNKFKKQSMEFEADQFQYRLHRQVVKRLGKFLLLQFSHL